MQDKYAIEGKFFWICDQELDIDLEGEIEFLDTDTYPTGEVRYESYRKEDKLHGPSYFYGPGGNLLSEAWFFEGVNVGKVIRYYPSGELYCIERYVEGLPHLLQEYFYLNQSVKTHIVYDRGKLDGCVYLYWPDGTLKRKSEYAQGTSLSDRYYDERGEEIFESSRSLP